MQLKLSEWHSAKVASIPRKGFFMTFVEILNLVVNILMLIVAVCLVVVVLTQDAKSSGLGSAFGNDTTSFGKARSAKATKEAKLQKLTVVFAIALGVLALILLVLPAFSK